MHQSRRRDQGIPFSSWIRYMQGRTAERYGSIDGQSSIQELRQNVMCHPCPEPSAPGGVASLDQEDAKLNFHQGYNGKIESYGVHAGQPGNYVRVGFAVASLAQLGEDVDVEQEHQEKSAGRQEI